MGNADLRIAQRKGTANHLFFAPGRDPSISSFGYAGFPIDPQSRQDFQPAIGQAADRIVVGSTVGREGVVVRGCPGRDLESRARPLLDDMAEVAITGFAEQDVGMFATTLRKRAGAGYRLQDRWGWIAISVIAQFGEEGRLS